MTNTMENIKNIASDAAMVPLTIVWFGWLSTSMGIPFLTYLYVNKLDEMSGLEPIYNDNIMWYTILGPFSIPIALYHAGSRTVHYLCNK